MTELLGDPCDGLQLPEEPKANRVCIPVECPCGCRGFFQVFYRRSQDAKFRFENEDRSLIRGRRKRHVS